MIVKVEFLDDDERACSRSEAGDKVIRAIDEVMGGALWKSVEGKPQSWMAKQ